MMNPDHTNPIRDTGNAAPQVSTGTRQSTTGVAETAASSRWKGKGSKKKKSKREVMLRCALCSVFPLGVIGFCAIIFGTVQLILRNILHEIGFTLIGIGGFFILMAIFLSVVAAYLPVKIKRREEMEWRLQVDGDVPVPVPART